MGKRKGTKHVSTVLTRDQILSVQDIVIEKVEVPEWGGTVLVRGLTGKDRDAFEAQMIDSHKEKTDKGVKTTREVNLRNLRAKLIVRCVVDGEDPQTAKPLFELTDIEALGKKSAAALQKVYEVAQRLSGLSNEDVDELTFELGEETSGGSGSPSQGT